MGTRVPAFPFWRTSPDLSDAAIFRTIKCSFDISLNVSREVCYRADIKAVIIAGHRLHSDPRRWHQDIHDIECEPDDSPVICHPDLDWFRSRSEREDLVGAVLRRINRIEGSGNQEEQWCGNNREQTDQSWPENLSLSSKKPLKSGNGITNSNVSGIPLFFLLRVG